LAASWAASVTANLEQRPFGLAFSDWTTSLACISSWPPLSSHILKTLRCPATPVVGKDQAMTRFINLIPGDVGRPVSHIASNMRYENLEQDAREVLATLNMKELEVWTKKDQCYVMKIRPYRTIDNVIDGVVVTFMDITEHKRMDERLTHALRYSEGIVNTVREPMLALTSDLRVKTANRSFYRFFKTTKEQTEGKLIYDLGNREWDIPKLRELLEKILPESLEMDDFKVVHEFSSIGKRTMILNARRLETGLDFGEMILLAIEDISEKQAKMTEVSHG
jgi:PAS domain-containing protein